MYDYKIKSYIDKWRVNIIEKYNIYQKTVAREEYQNNIEIRKNKIDKVKKNNQYRNICIVFRNILL